jgi:hypothetical protein
MSSSTYRYCSTSHFHVISRAQSLASAYGLQSSCLRLAQVITSLLSRLSQVGGALTRSPFQVAVNKSALRGAQRYNDGKIQY